MKKGQSLPEPSGRVGGAARRQRSSGVTVVRLPGGLARMHAGARSGAGGRAGLRAKNDACLGLAITIS